MIPEITNHLWQSTLFAVFAGLLTLTLSQTQARVRYWLWLAASLKFLVPFSVLMWVGSHWEWRANPAPADWSAALEAISEPFATPATSLSAVPPTREHTSLIPVLVGLAWLSGLATVVFSRGRDWTRIRATLRAASPSGLSGDIALRSSPSLMEPGVFGIFRPVLILPEGIENRLTPLELEAVIAHELCHVRRRDNLAAAMHMLVEAIFWFHPLVWWLGARLVDERERACDEEVLRSGSQPEVYAESILKACRFYLESPLSCVSGVTGSDLKNRIERIMNHPIQHKLDFGRKLLLATAAIAAVTGPVAIGLLNAPLTRAQTQPASRAPLAFEVASVKPNKSYPKPRFDIAPGRITFTAATLGDCLERAYGIKPYQLFGPDWLKTERYEVIAKAEGDANHDQLMLMLQTLLADRFKLATHKEAKELPVYALTLAKTGPKFHASEGDGTPRLMPQGGALQFQKYSMQDLAGFLSRIGDIGRPVIDKTGLQGTFDFAIHLFDKPNMTPLEMKQSMEQGLHDSSMFTNLQEQLGLKLLGEKDTIDVLVVDHAERVPTGN